MKCPHSTVLQEMLWKISNMTIHCKIKQSNKTYNRIIRTLSLQVFIFFKIFIWGTVSKATYLNFSNNSRISLLYYQLNKSSVVYHSPGARLHTSKNERNGEYLKLRLSRPISNKTKTPAILLYWLPIDARTWMEPCS